MVYEMALEGMQILSKQIPLGIEIVANDMISGLTGISITPTKVSSLI